MSKIWISCHINIYTEFEKKRRGPGPLRNPKKPQEGAYDLQIVNVLEIKCPYIETQYIFRRFRGLRTASDDDIAILKVCDGKIFRLYLGLAAAIVPHRLLPAN